MSTLDSFLASIVDRQAFSLIVMYFESMSVLS